MAGRDRSPCTCKKTTCTCRCHPRPRAVGVESNPFKWAVEPSYATTSGSAYTKPTHVSIKSEVEEATKRTRATNWSFGSDRDVRQSTHKLDYTDPKAAHTYHRVPRPFNAPFQADGSARDWVSTVKATYKPHDSAARSRAFNLGPELRCTHWTLGSDVVRPQSTMREDFPAPSPTGVRLRSKTRYPVRYERGGRDLGSSLPFPRAASAAGWVSVSHATFTELPICESSAVDLALQQSHFAIGSDTRTFDSTHRVDYRRPETGHQCCECVAARK